MLIRLELTTKKVQYLNDKDRVTFAYWWRQWM